MTCYYIIEGKFFSFFRCVYELTWVRCAPPPRGEVASPIIGGKLLSFLYIYVLLFVERFSLLDKMLFRSLDPFPLENLVRPLPWIGVGSASFCVSLLNI